MCACCLLGVLRVCVYPFCVWGVARGLHALACASTPSLRERPQCNARRTSRIHTPPTTGRAVPGSRASCSPLRRHGVSSLASQTSWAWFGNAVLRSAPMPEVVAPITLAFCVPPKRVILKSPEASRHPCTGVSRLKTPVSPSSSRMDGKAHVSSSPMDGS